MRNILFIKNNEHIFFFFVALNFFFIDIYVGGYWLQLLNRLGEGLDHIKISEVTLTIDIVLRDDLCQICHIYLTAVNVKFRSKFNRQSSEIDWSDTNVQSNEKFCCIYGDSEQFFIWVIENLVRTTGNTAKSVSLCNPAVFYRLMQLKNIKCVYIKI